MHQIGLGMQLGGTPGCREKMSPIHATVNRILREQMKGDYFDGIDGMGFLFRVSGEITDFGGEGVERLFHRKKDRSIEIDVVFPERIWRDLSVSALWEWTARHLEEAMAMMIERGLNDDVIRDAETLRRDFGVAIAAFRDEVPSAS